MQRRIQWNIAESSVHLGKRWVYDLVGSTAIAFSSIRFAARHLCDFRSVQPDRLSSSPDAPPVVVRARPGNRHSTTRIPVHPHNCSRLRERMGVASSDISLGALVHQGAHPNHAAHSIDPDLQWAHLPACTSPFTRSWLRSEHYSAPT